MSIRGILFFVLLVVLGIRCAQIVQPTGGPKDELPPVLLLDKSTANGQVRFEKQDIILEFDEFVKLQNPGKQIVISPPFEQFPKITTRGKKVTIKFDKEEEFKEDATYVINFGDAIQDFNESNKLKNFRFIFATGDEIDSLEISGTVIDVTTGEPAKEHLVMLYESFEDSVVYQQRPFYFASTDDKGVFHIKNMRADTFKLFVLKDENVNYLYDLDNEAIGFLDSLVIVTDTIVQDFDLEVFVENPKFALKELVNDQYGLVELKYSTDVKDLSYSTRHDSFGLIIPEREKNRLKLWYDFPQDSTITLYLDDGKDYQDTLKIRKKKKAKFLEDAELELVAQGYAEAKNISPFDSFAFTVSYPIAGLNADSITVLGRDSTVVTDYEVRLDTQDRRQFYLKHQFEPDSSYSMTILPGAITDIHGLTLDTTQLDFTVLKPGYFGAMVLSFDEMNPEISYVIDIMDGDRILHQRIIQKDSVAQYSFAQLLPKGYKIRITEDANNNGEWDTGSYAERRQAEVIREFDTEKMKSGWETEVNFVGLEMKGGVVPEVRDNR